MRRFSIDELPQFINVLREEMSIVGPRPPLRREVEAYDCEVLRRLLVKPGITGLWQVSGRSDLSWNESRSSGSLICRQLVDGHRYRDHCKDIPSSLPAKGRLLMGIRGMIASGGTDSNLRPVTMDEQVSLAVYDKPMIYGLVSIRPDLLGERMAE